MINETYCLKCNEKTKDRDAIAMSCNGRFSTKSACSVCGRKRFRFTVAPKMGSGSELDAALTVVKPLQELAKKLISDADVAKLDQKLAKLKAKKGLFGSGVDKQKQKKMNELIEKYSGEMIGCGLINSSDLEMVKNGFLYMFTKPKEGSELFARLVADAGQIDSEDAKRQYEVGAQKNGYRTGSTNTSANSDAYNKKYQGSGLKFY